MGGIAPLVPTQGLFPSQDFFKNHIPIFFYQYFKFKFSLLKINFNSPNVVKNLKKIPLT